MKNYIKNECFFVLCICVAASAFAKPSKYDVGYFEDAQQLTVAATNGVRQFASTAKPQYEVDTKQGHLVDLHMHTFQHGLGFLSKGSFYDSALFAKWDSRFDNKVNDEGLNTSGLGLVVVALYGHPILTPSAKSAVREQIRMAEKFVRDYPNWAIAKNSEQARQAYSEGKNVLVFSIEGAGGMLNSEADLQEFIDEAGVSIVTFSHLIDDDLSGAALMSSYGVFGNPGSVFEAWSMGSYGRYGELLNIHGLTSQGRWLAKKLIERKVWIDLAHASEATTKGLLPLLKEAGQPLLYTHGGLRAHKHEERSISKEQLQAVKESGGIVGLVAAESALGSLHVKSTNCPAHCHGKCKGGVFGVAGLFNEAVALVGPKHVFLGTDLSGAMDHVKPNRDAGCVLGSSLDEQGYANVSQTADLWQDLRAAGALVEENQKNGVLNFIEVWSKVR